MSGSDPGSRLATVDGVRLGSAVAAPKSGKMVYVLVAVLIAAICVLAVLLFSGGGPAGKRTGGIEPQESVERRPL